MVEENVKEAAEEEPIEFPAPQPEDGVKVKLDTGWVVQELLRGRRVMLECPGDQNPQNYRNRHYSTLYKRFMRTAQSLGLTKRLYIKQIRSRKWYAYASEPDQKLKAADLGEEKTQGYGRWRYIANQLQNEPGKPMHFPTREQAHRAAQAWRYHIPKEDRAHLTSSVTQLGDDESLGSVVLVSLKSG